jgi:hypothetical protein
MVKLFIEIQCNLYLFEEVPQSIEEVKTELKRYREES